MTEWETDCRNEKTFSVWIGRWDRACKERATAEREERGCRDAGAMRMQLPDCRLTARGPAQTQREKAPSLV